jgi:putative Holliday junction resolvase
MRYLGIDFGLRFIGLALSDEEGRFAMPLAVLEQPKHLVEEIKKTAEENNVGAIVIGESRDFQGKENAVMAKIHHFKREVEAATKLPVHLQAEFLTSHQASRLQGENKKSDKLHSSAAALILQSFLDTMNMKPANEEEISGRWQKDRPE